MDTKYNYQLNMAEHSRKRLREEDDDSGDISSSDESSQGSSTSCCDTSSHYESSDGEMDEEAEEDDVAASIGFSPESKMTKVTLQSMYGFGDHYGHFLLLLKSMNRHIKKLFHGTTDMSYIVRYH